MTEGDFSSEEIRFVLPTPDVGWIEMHGLDPTGAGTWPFVTLELTSRAPSVAWMTIDEPIDADVFTFAIPAPAARELAERLREAAEQGIAHVKEIDEKNGLA